MLVIKSSKLIAVDIDNTLAIWNGEDYYINEEYVMLIKQFHKRGHTLIAWSAGGFAWAERIVKEFQLESYFEACMGKPDWFMDDKPSSEFLPEANRICLTIDTK